MNNDLNEGDNSDEKHWSHIDYYWCTYEDDSQSKISGVWAQHQPHPKNAILIPASEINKTEIYPEEKFIQRLQLKTIDDLFRLANRYDTGTPKPLYRGQSNYSWNLATPLERDAPEFVIKETGLEIYEHQVMNDSQRRFHEFFPQLPDEKDYLSWLALLRHRGVPTRLLDVTRSLYIACYFAIRDARPGIDAALWIFTRDKIDSAFDRWCYRANKTWFRKSIATVAQYNEPIYWPFPKDTSERYTPPTIETLQCSFSPKRLDFTLTIDAAIRGFVDKPGVAVVEPFWLSRRMDFQQGAFLVPFNVRYDFEHNLLSYLNISKDETDERDVPTDEDELLNLWCHAKVIKLRIPANLHASLKVKLESMNIRDLTLFPDIDGALSHLTSLIPRQYK